MQFYYQLHFPQLIITYRNKMTTEERKPASAQEVQFFRQVNDKFFISTSTDGFDKAHVVVAVGIVAKSDKIPKMIQFGLPNTELVDAEIPKVVMLCISIVTEIIKIQSTGKTVLVYSGDNPQGALLLAGFYKRKLGESPESVVKWLNTLNYTDADYAWERTYNNAMVKAYETKDMITYKKLSSETPKGVFRFTSFMKCLYK